MNNANGMFGILGKFFKLIPFGLPCYCGKSNSCFVINISYAAGLSMNTYLCYYQNVRENDYKLKTKVTDLIFRISAAL